MTLRLLNSRRWRIFWWPVDATEDPEYYEVVASPMDLASMLSKVDSKAYVMPQQWLADVQLIVEVWTACACVCVCLCVRMCVRI